MRVVYIAEDGKKFDDEFECQDYEWKLKHTTHLKDIHLFDKDGNELEDIFSDDTYDNADKVIVLTDEAIKDLQELAEYTGFICYDSITSPGEWMFNKRIHEFVKQE